MPGFQSPNFTASLPAAIPAHSILLCAVSGLCLSHLDMRTWSKTATGSNFTACAKKMKWGV